MKKKPKILPEKIELANLIRKFWTKTSKGFDPPHGYYWSGTFESKTGLKVYIYLQRYSRGYRKMQIDYVNIRWENEEFKNRALYVGDIKPLLKDLKGNKEL